MKVVAVIGSYRKGGVIDTAVGAILASAGESGAQTEKIYLIDRHIEFCTNCRSCTQVPGEERGECIFDDDMNSVLEAIAEADALVIGSPMNFGTVTAVMKRFIERLICFACWPWGENAPAVRNPRKNKPAVVVASSAAPSVIARLTTGQVKLMKKAVGLLGGKTTGVLFIGLAARKQQQEIGARAGKKARALGRKLVSAKTSVNFRQKRV